MAQTSILGRVGQLLRANINAMLDGAEDPEKMLDQMIRDFTNNMSEAEEAVAQTIGNLRMVEDDAKEAPRDGRRMGRQGGRRVPQGRRTARCRRASPRPTGSTSLAKLALNRQISYENQDKTLQTQVDQQTRARRAAQGRPHQDADPPRGAGPEARRAGRPRQDGPGPDAGPETLKNVSVMDPTSELSQYEEKIRRQEAMARGMAEVNATLARGAVRVAGRERRRPRGGGPAGGPQGQEVALRSIADSGAGGRKRSGSFVWPAATIARSTRTSPGRRDCQ